MIAAIMQPTFLPWIGYFDLIDQADIFVFLDTVQFEKQSWQQRNRVRTPKGLEWLTIPVFITGRFGQTIREVEIKADAFPDKQIKTLQQHYSKTPYFNDYWPELEAILLSAKEGKFLAKLNMAIICWLAGRLGISSRFVLASDLNVEDHRSERLVGILKNIGADRYLSPVGSMAYLIQDREVFSRAGIPILLHTFVHPEYTQRYAPFEIGASAIDMLFNEGATGTAGLMRSGRRVPERFEDAVEKKKDTVHAH